MGVFLTSRKRLLSHRGHAMTLRRQTALRPPAYAARDLLGASYSYTPEQITQGMQQGDALVQIMAADLADWPAPGSSGPPRAQDSVLYDGQTWVVQGVQVVREGAEVIGYGLHVRGGGQ